MGIAQRHTHIGVTQQTRHDRHRYASHPVEADEAYIGGKRKNMPKSRHEAMKGAG